MRIVHRRRWRHPATLAALAGFAGAAVFAGVRYATTDVYGGGAYEARAEMNPNGEASTGAYLAVTYRRADVTAFGDIVTVVLGGTVTAPPKTPDQYSPVTRVEHTEASSIRGGETSIDQAADAAWAAAHFLLEQPLDAVSSVLNVVTVDPDGPLAAVYDIRPGDRIVQVNERPANAFTWMRYVERGVDVEEPRHVAGRDLTLTIADDDQTTTVDLVVQPQLRLQETSNGTRASIEGTIGVEVEEIARIDSERPRLYVPPKVTGPSSGILYALLYLDMLTPGDLTGGLRVAATGTVNSIGRIGSIGAVDHKADAAVAADADVMFIPMGNRYQVPEEIHDDLVVVPVVTVDDAVRWLCANGGTSTACYHTWTTGPAVGIPDGFEHLVERIDARRSARKGLKPIDGQY